MKDTDFEQASRAHSFWQDRQGAADRAGEGEPSPFVWHGFVPDKVSTALSIDPETGESVFVVTTEFNADLSLVPLPDSAKAEGVLSFSFEPDTFTDAVAASSPDWDFAINDKNDFDVEVIHASFFKKVN